MALTRVAGIGVAGLLALAQPVWAVNPDDCTGCAGHDLLDTCLMQSWAASYNGPAHWLQSRGVPFTITRETDYVITFHSDGEFVIEPYQYDFTMTSLGITSRGSGESSGGRGCWSVTRPNTLNLCHVGDGPKISVNMTMPDGRVIRNVNPMLQKPTSAWAYHCTEPNRLVLDIATSPSTGPIPVHMHPHAP